MQFNAKRSLPAIEKAAKKTVDGRTFRLVPGKRHTIQISASGTGQTKKA